MAQEAEMMAIEQSLQKAMEQVQLVLHAEKAPCFAADVHHEYRDKYLLAECMTNGSMASLLNSLATIGLSAGVMAQLRTWAATSAVSLRFRAEERCVFDRTETRDEESKTKHKETFAVLGIERSSITSQVITTITEHFYRRTVSYELLAVRGAGHEEGDRIRVLAREGGEELKTTSSVPPHPEAKLPATECSVNISWLCRHLQQDSITPAFFIDRSQRSCKTPRRNPAVDGASGQFDQLRRFVSSVVCYLKGLLPSDASQYALPDAVFVPTLPLLDRAKEAAGAGDAAPASEAPRPQMLASFPDAAAPAGSALLSSADSNELLVHEVATLQKCRADAQAALPPGEGGAVATAAEAVLAITLGHCAHVMEQWLRCMNYIEGLLRRQLVAAIGKEVSPEDFAEYMRYHNNKLFRPAFAPVPFCFAVRRSERHGPEGTVSIEQDMHGGGDTNVPLPIETVVAKSQGSHPMTFKLGAATEVSFDGDKYLHAWVDHRFRGQSGSSLKLVARSRQFSSMLVLVGRISSATRFDPKYAAIVQNKDELTIPLELSTIPTPQEFKDAIESLSPEQQAFAQAFRSMQLEGTMFGVLVVQIKPQLEKVLNLPCDSLTKEIKLTQDLMQLFIKYHISSDLLSFEQGVGADAMEMVGVATGAERLEAVKRHVQAMQEMISLSKSEEMEDRRMTAAYEQPLADWGVPESAHTTRSMSQSADLLGLCDMSANVEETNKSFMKTAKKKGSGGMLAFRRSGAPEKQSISIVSDRDPCLESRAPQRKLKQHGAQQQQQPPQQQPPPQQAQERQHQQPQQQRPDSAQRAMEQDGVPGGPSMMGPRDYTQVPQEMDKQFERLDTDSALRPTKITPKDVWTKRAQAALLASPTTTSLGSTEQKREKDAAFDLLDALTKSGAVPLQNAALHILIAATHCFDKCVTDSVVQDNVNPIEKVERSTLIMASTVHQLPAAELICDVQQPRVSAASPALFISDASL